MSKSKIIIGNAGGKNVGFDLDVLLPSRLLITADSGGGKSFLIRALCEQLFGKVQTIIIDPEGEFATLREKFAYVLVGKGGETLADVRSAGLLATRLLELRASAVCDIFEMKSADRHLWVKNFLDAMIEAPKTLRTPCVVIVDEAQMFAPENSFGESIAKPAMIDMSTRGRKRFLCLVCATPRLAGLDKSVTSNLQNRLVGPTFEQVNLKRAAEVLSIPQGAEQKEFFKQIKLLEPGYFYALGRAIARERTLIKIRDVVTSHPKAFERKTAEPPPAPEKIKALLPKLADLPAEAEEKARTEADFRREIRELKTKLTLSEKEKAKPGQVAKADPARARAVQQMRAALEEARTLLAKISALTIGNGVIDRQQIETAVKDAVERILRLSMQASAKQQQQFEQVKREAKPILEKLQRLLDAPTTTAIAPQSPAAEKPAAMPRESSPVPTEALSSEPISVDGLSQSQARIVRAVAEFSAIGIREVSRKWLAARAGASHSSSSYQNNLGTLRSRGLIDYKSGNVYLTPAGLDLAGPLDAPLTPEELAGSCKRLLTDSQKRIFDALYKAYPHGVKREDLAAQVGATITSSSFQNNLGSLRSAGMIAYGPDQTVHMEKWIFMEDAA